MIDENGIQINNYDFGTMYFGQYKDKPFYLVNNSPVPQPFQAKFLMGKKDSDEDLEKKKDMPTPYKVGLEQT